MRTVLNRALAACLAVAALLIAGVPASFAQQQTGSLVLEILADNGEPIPNAQVTITSDRTAPQTRTGDDRGRTRFLLLPPGTYTVEVRAEGYTATRRQIAVPLGGTVNEPVLLSKGELTETVEITAMPEVDVTETSTGEVYTTEEMQNIQIGSGNRSYLSVLGNAAGVVGGGGNPSVHGATIGENVYLIDGVNTTDPVTGTFGLLTNFDAIDQIELKTGGFQAQYGWSTGGYVNQVTKSGTNEFDGTFDARYYDQNFVENTKHFPGEEAQEFRQLSFTLGGPIKKDKVWFFVAAEDNVTNLAVSGAPVTRSFDGASYLAKLTFQLAPRHRLAIQYSADPAEIENDNASEFVSPEAGDLQKQGADFFKLTYWGGLTDEWALAINLGMYQSTLDVTDLSGNGLPSVADIYTGHLFQNYNDIQLTDRANDQASVMLERAWSGKRGDHDLKFGADIQRTELVALRDVPGGEAWTSLGCGDDLAERTCLEGDLNGDGIPDNIIIREVTQSVGDVTNPGDTFSLYAQDTWRWKKITLDYGLRWDRARSEREDGKTVVDMDLLQPRLGMSFDIKGDRTQKVYWTLTRRMHPGILALPSVVNNRNNTSDVYYHEVNVGEYLGFDPGEGIDFDGNGVVDNGFVFVGSNGGPASSRIDENLKPTYLDEFIFGWERVLKQRHVLGARLVMNETKDIIEDTLDTVDPQTYVVENYPGLERTYEGIELEYGWRHRRGVLAANWTIARAKGNVEYTQGLGSDFDLAGQHDVNRYGYLSNDRRHRIKLFGWTNLPKGFSLHYSLFHGSGLPYDRLELLGGPDPATGLDLYGVKYLDPRGSHRLPSITTLDAEFRKTWRFGTKDDKRLMLIGSVLNVLGANSVTARNTVWNPIEVVPDDPATPEDETVIENDWGNATAHQDPRTYEIGLRFEF